MSETETAQETEEDQGVVQVELPPKLIPVFDGEADFRCAYGGRGSGKTHTFAKMAAIYGYTFAEANMPGIILCGRQYQNSLADSSFSEVKRAIESESWLSSYYEIGESFIRTKNRRIVFIFTGLHINLNSVKGKSLIRLFWVDEAEDVIEIAWDKAIPTIREDKSEIWVTWNPERKNSPTDKRFRQSTPDRCKIACINWRDNPWFSELSNRLRIAHMQSDPDTYFHVWEGDYITERKGAYYAKHLSTAREEKRIGLELSRDPLLPIYAFIDIGGTGQRADAFAMWIAQFIGDSIKLLDYYEAQGQELTYHVNWLRSKKYDDVNIVLPHDGAQHEKTERVTYKSKLMEIGFSAEVVQNQGSGAALARIDCARRKFMSMYFDHKCEPGIEALGWYSEKWDEKRSIGLGPDHDWSSHCADAFGLLCIYHEMRNESATGIRTRTNALDYSYYDGMVI